VFLIRSTINLRIKRDQLQLSESHFRIWKFGEEGMKYQRLKATCAPAGLKSLGILDPDRIWWRQQRDGGHRPPIGLDRGVSGGGVCTLPSFAPVSVLVSVGF
jgi:hypothetical protein